MMTLARRVAIIALLTGVFLTTPVHIALAAGPLAPTLQDAAQTICASVNGANKSTCEGCIAGGGAYTAIGCIPGTLGDFITHFLGLGAGIAGGISFLLILFGGLQIMTSAGNPEKLNEGRELISSAITGLLIIIFSVFILRVIGYNILGIPGFG